MLNTQLWTELAIKLGQIMAAIALVLFLVHLLRQYFSQQIEDADIRTAIQKQANTPIKPRQELKLLASMLKYWEHSINVDSPRVSPKMHYY